ncbi:hypothetical protein [Nocardia brasiliensis]|uniref:hypothetical protein n=1 Tax=Nocardia brasiliensis TaxID=37326 RepID=UPI003D8F0158
MLVALADNAILASETPMLKVAVTGAAEGTKYCFKVSSETYTDPAGSARAKPNA